MVTKPVLLIAAGVLMAVIPSVVAQTEPSAPLPNQAVTLTSQQDQEIAKQLAHWTKKLKLSAEQQSGIKPILEDRERQMQTLRDDRSLAAKERVANAETIQQDADLQIEAFLEQNQRRKYEKEQAAIKERMQESGNPAPDSFRTPMNGSGPGQ